MNENNQPTEDIDVEDVEPENNDKQQSKAVKIFSSLLDKAQKKIDAHQETKKNNQDFEQSAIRFTIFNDKMKNGDFSDAVQFFAIKSMQDHSLLVRIKDKLIVNTVIVSNEGSFIIRDVDSKTLFDYPLDNSSTCPIKCYKCLYEGYTAPTASVVNNTVNQSMTIEGDANGDITQIATLQSDLERIESEIQKFKPTLFNKKKKDDAIVLFGNFKNCIINKQKDESLFSKFLEVLKVVAPAAISLATALIQSL